MKFRVFEGKLQKQLYKNIFRMYRYLTSKNIWSFVPGWFPEPYLWILITCCKFVLDLETFTLQLFITEEPDPHETTTGINDTGTGCAAETMDERWETKGTIPHLDVVKTTIKRCFNVKQLVEEQLDSLAGQGCRKTSTVSLSVPQI